MGYLPSFDEGESEWVERAVEHVQEKLHEYEYPEYRARQLIPSNIDSSPADRKITYDIYNKIGMFKIISTSGRDLPRIDLFAESVSTEAKSLGAKYGWTRADVRLAIKNNSSLGERKGREAREAQLRAENNIAWFGDRKYKLQGLIEYPNSLRVILSNATGTGAAKNAGNSIVAKRNQPKAQLKVLQAMAMASAVATQGVERPDTLLLPLQDYTIVSETELNDSDTVLSFFRKHNPFITYVDWIPELEKASSNGHNVYLCYKRDPSKLELVVPMEFRSYAPQEVGLDIEVPCESTCAGVIVYKPMSVAWAEVRNEVESTTTDPTPEDPTPAGKKTK